MVCNFACAIFRLNFLRIFLEKELYVFHQREFLFLRTNRERPYLQYKSTYQDWQSALVLKFLQFRKLLCHQHTQQRNSFNWDDKRNRCLQSFLSNHVPIEFLLETDSKLDSLSLNRKYIYRACIHHVHQTQNHEVVQ